MLSAAMLRIVGSVLGIAVVGTSNVYALVWLSEMLKIYFSENLDSLVKTLLKKSFYDI
jgi:hypothetical protein